jgi:hypothetical protein
MPERMIEFVVPTTYFRVMRWVLSWLGIPHKAPVSYWTIGSIRSWPR